MSRAQLSWQKGVGHSPNSNIWEILHWCNVQFLKLRKKSKQKWLYTNWVRFWEFIGQIVYAKYCKLYYSWSMNIIFPQFCNIKKGYGYCLYNVYTSAEWVAGEGFWAVWKLPVWFESSGKRNPHRALTSCAVFRWPLNFLQISKHT